MPFPQAGLIRLDGAGQFSPESALPAGHPPDLTYSLWTSCPGSCLTCRVDAATVKARLGAAIRERRQELGLSQEAAAHEAGISATYWSDCENGKRNPASVNIVRIAGALGTSAAQLFTEAGL